MLWWSVCVLVSTLVGCRAMPISSRMCKRAADGTLSVEVFTEMPADFTYLYVTFLDDAGTEKVDTCSTTSNQITGTGTATDRYRIKIVVNPTTPDMDSPDCGHSRVGDVYTWRLSTVTALAPPLGTSLPNIAITQDVVCDFALVAVDPPVNHVWPISNQSCSRAADGTLSVEVFVEIPADFTYLYVTFLDDAGTEQVTTCSTTNGQITGSGTPADPFFIKIDVDSNANPDSGAPDCGLSRVGDVYTWRISTVTVLAPPFEFPLPNKAVTEYIVCDYATVVEDRPENPGWPIGTGKCRRAADGTLSVEVFVEIADSFSYQYVTFLDDAGTEEVATCSTTNGQITGSGTTADPFRIKIDVNPTTPDNGAPDCGLSRVGDVYTWRLSTVTVLAPPFGTPLPNTAVTQYVVCDYATVAEDPPSQGQLKTSKRCSRAADGTLSVEVFVEIPDSFNYEYITFLDDAGTEKVATCSNTNGQITGSGTATDPYRIKIDVHRSSQNIGTPDCGLSRVGDVYKWRLSTVTSLAPSFGMSSPNTAVIQEVVCDYARVTENPSTFIRIMDTP